MELRRELIERRDFPQVRRGHDPEAVNEHLREVAKAVEELRHSKGSADSTATHVRSIIEAAERASTELEQSARIDAERMRAGAKEEAESRLTSARNEAETTLTSARAEAKSTLDSARSEAAATLASAKEESEKTVTNANASAHQTLSSAKAEAETTLTSAKAEADKMVTGANASAHATLSSAKTQAEKTVSEANASADTTLSRAKSESERMLTSARNEADKTLSGARAEAASTRASSRAEAQAHMERVEQAVMRLLERAGLVEGELGKLVGNARGSIAALAETVRDGAEKLRTELDVPREERSSGRFARPGDSGSAGAPKDDAPAADDTPARAVAPAAPAATPAKPAAATPSHPAAPAKPPTPPAPAKPAAAATPTPPPAPPAAPSAPEASTPAPARPSVGDQGRLGWGASPAAGTGSPRPTQKGFLGNLIRPAPAAAPQAAAADAPGSTGVGPRLEAFNMARSGAPRHEVAQHLKEKFGLDDPSEILDDAFSRAGN